MGKGRDEPAAIKRAVERAGDLCDADLKDVVKRLKAGEPKSGLQDMAYVEEIAGSVSPSGRRYLVDQLEALQADRLAEDAEPAAK